MDTILCTRIFIMHPALLSFVWTSVSKHAFGRLAGPHLSHERCMLVRQNCMIDLLKLASAKVQGNTLETKFIFMVIFGVLILKDPV